MMLVQPKIKTIEIPDKFSPKGYHILSYAEWGLSTNSNVLVCVHGLTRNGRDFDHFAQIAMHDYRVISVDIAGRGQSEWLNDHTQYNYELYVADMVYLLQELGLEQVHWLGTSMGGIIGMMVASLNTDLIGKLVVNDVGAMIPGESIERIMQYVRHYPEFATREELKVYMQTIFANFGIRSDEHWEHMLDHGHTKTKQGDYCLSYDPMIAQAIIEASSDVYEDIDLWDIWNKVNMSVLIIRGEKTDLLPKDIMEQMCIKPKVESIEYKDIGHAPALMEEEHIHPIMQWLSK